MKVLNTTGCPSFPTLLTAVREINCLYLFHTGVRRNEPMYINVNKSKDVIIIKKKFVQI